MSLNFGGLFIRWIFASEIRGTNFREDLFFEKLIIGILRYIIKTVTKLSDVIDLTTGPI